MKNFQTSAMLVRRKSSMKINCSRQTADAQFLPLPLLRPDQFLQGPLCLAETDRAELLSKYGLSQAEDFCRRDEKNKSCWYDFPLLFWRAFRRFFSHSVTYLCWETKLFPVFSLVRFDFMGVLTKIITENIAGVIYCIFTHNVKSVSQSL